MQYKRNRKERSEVICLTCKQKIIVKNSRAKTFKTCSKKCFGIYKTGHIPYHYKGGKLFHKGYIYILCKKHPNGDRDGYVLEHRLVIEKHIGRFLDSKEIIHHKNGIRNDNRIENLELLKSQSEHMKEHWHDGTFKSSKEFFVIS